MAILKFKQGQFQVARQIMDARLFDAWVAAEGRGIFAERYRALYFPKLLGRFRTRYLIQREMRRVLAPKARFAAMLAQELDELPLFVRKIAHTIRRRGFKDLMTVDGHRSVLVIPRGIIQQDFVVMLKKELGESRELAAFPGLANRVLSMAGREAEELLFEELSKGRPHPDSSGRGVLLDVDRSFRWRINNLDGHYYYAFTQDESEMLTDARTLKRFRNAMKEAMQAQVVHLKRLPDHERTALADAFKSIGVAVPPDQAPVPGLLGASTMQRGRLTPSK